MTEEQVLKDIKMLIDSGKLGEIPAINDSDFFKVADSLIKDKEKFAIMLSMLSVFSDGKYIRLFGEFAKTSVDYKIKRLAYLPNITLDILFWLEMIAYLEVKENSIVIKILNNDLAEELSVIKAKLKEQKQEFVSVDKYYETLKEFEEFKKKYN